MHNVILDVSQTLDRLEEQFIIQNTHERDFFLFYSRSLKRR